MAIALNPAADHCRRGDLGLDVLSSGLWHRRLRAGKARLGVAMIMIGMIWADAQMADRIAVMYAVASRDRRVRICCQPGHPYSEILIASVPSLTERQPCASWGDHHDRGTQPPGCIFQLRCPHVAGALSGGGSEVAREIRPGKPWRAICGRNRGRVCPRPNQHPILELDVFQRSMATRRRGCCAERVLALLAASLLPS
jgi:ABC-type glutathione transport system ATPase component